MSAQLVVLECGPATSIQDGGRFGFQRQGLSPSGPMDAFAFAAANALVGNGSGEAALELGFARVCLRAEGGHAQLALAGAPFGIRVNGDPVGDHRSFTLPEGAELVLTPPRSGVFGYLAVAGGIDAPKALGSRAFHRRAGLGGIEGRSLQAGDSLSMIPTQSLRHCCFDPLPLDLHEPIRVVLGPQDNRFGTAAIDTFLNAAFAISVRADRMGISLDGPIIEHGAEGFNIVSDATVFGSVQVPGNGHPIVLMADRQTTGGYPKIATVVSADLRRIAQRRPGDSVCFQSIEVAEAVSLARERAKRIAGLPGTLLTVMTREERLMTSNVAGDAVDALTNTGAP